MKTSFLILFYILTFSKLNGQSKYTPKIDIGVGFRFSSWVIDDSKTSTRNPYDFVYGFQDNKARLTIDLKQKLFQKSPILIQLSNSFAYTEFRKVRASPNSNVYISDKTLKHDHFLDLLYPFKSKKNRPQFVVGGGLGYMNCGTKFNYTKYIYTSPSTFTTEQMKGTMRFFAPRILLGLQKKSINAFAILHGTPDMEGEPYPTIWMEIKASILLKDFSMK